MNPYLTVMQVAQAVAVVQPLLAVLTVMAVRPLRQVKVLLAV
jgi:hypothetical protein